MPLGLFRKRKKETLADGTKRVTVTDRKGRVRKQKLVKPSGIKEKQKYDKAGNIHTAKLKGPGIRKKKIDAKGLGITNINTPGYKWADNPNKKKTAPVKKTTPKKTKVVLNDGGKKTNTNTKKNNTTTKVNKKTNTTTTPKKQTFGEAYSAQRKKNIKNKIAHFGDSKGYFTYEGKKYNTESKAEKNTRLNPPTPKKDAKADAKGSKVIDDITRGKKNNKADHSKSQINRDKKFNNKYMRKGGSVKGIGQWAGKNVPGMRKGK